MDIGFKPSSMTLYSGACDQYSHRVRMVLAEKGVSAAIEEVDPNNKPPELAEINPDNSIPTLTDRDLVVYESIVIMEYLDERFPHPPLLPVYPVERAKSRLLMRWIQNEWAKNVDLLMAGKGRATVLEKAHKELRDSLVMAAPGFVDKQFLASDEITLVDCCVAPILWRLKSINIKLPGRQAKAINRYMEMMFRRPTFRKSLTEAEAEMQE